MNNVLSLRDYINNKDSLGDDVKAKTFCRLMKKVMENLPIHSTLNSISRHILLWLILWGVAYLINKYVPELIGKKENINR